MSINLESFTYAIPFQVKKMHMIERDRHVALECSSYKEGWITLWICSIFASDESKMSSTTC